MEFVCGGYFLAKDGKSLADCSTTFFPDSWAIEWASRPDDRQRAADALGIRGSDLPALMAEVTRLFNEGAFHWPNVIGSIAQARRVLRLAPAESGLQLFGLGIPPADVAALIASNAPAPQQPGFAPMGAGGIYEMLSRRRPLEPGFTILGFDAVHIGYGLLLQSVRESDNTEALLPDWDSAQRAAAAQSTPSTSFTPVLIARYDSDGP